MADGERQLALCVLDLLALAPDGDRAVAEARDLKSEIAAELGREHSSFTSANLYRTMSRYPHDRAD